MQANFNKFWLAFKDLIYPARCASCGRLLEDAETGVCNSCLAKIKFIEAPYCKICSRPIRSPVSTNQICSTCRNSKDKLLVVAGAEYVTPLKEIISNYKYLKQEFLCQFLVTIIEHNDRFDDLIGSADILIPIPLHKNRLRWRGFNQARAIAKIISKKYAKEILPRKSFVRDRNTLPQAKLDRRERLKNIKGAFVIKNNQRIIAKKVVLLDDVYTTGSTAKECAKVLLKSGAASVALLVVAR